jgi:hypothetical protein
MADEEYRLDEDQLDNVYRSMISPLLRLRGNLTIGDLTGISRMVDTYMGYIEEDLAESTIEEVAQALANIAERIRMEYESMGVDVEDVDFPNEDNFLEAIEEVIDEADEDGDRSPSPQAYGEWTPSDFVSQPLPDINYIAPERYGDPQGYLEQPRSRANTTGTDPAEDFYPDEDPSGSGRRRRRKMRGAGNATTLLEQLLESISDEPDSVKRKMIDDFKGQLPKRKGFLGTNWGKLPYTDEQLRTAYNHALAEYRMYKNELGDASPTSPTPERSVSRPYERGETVEDKLARGSTAQPAPRTYDRELRDARNERVQRALTPPSSPTVVPTAQPSAQPTRHRVAFEPQLAGATTGLNARGKSRAKVYKMPYKLRKCPNKDLYWVVNKETGKKHSKDGLPKEQAKAQMRALYANEKRGGGVLASHPAIDTLYEKADAFTASLEADNTRQLAQEASRAKNKGAMELAMTTSMPKEEALAKGGKRSHKAQHIRYMLGKLKEKQKGYNKPFNPFNPKLVSKGKRSKFLNRMMSEGSVVPKRDAKNKPVEEKVVEKVVEKKTDGRKKRTVRLSETLEQSPAPVATTPLSRDERIKQLKAEGLSTRAIADKMKAEGFKKVSASTVSNVLKSVKGSGYDEHPEDFFF